MNRFQKGADSPRKKNMPAFNNRAHVVDLDSTTPSKFSRHLIFRVPESVFMNSATCGDFVRHICGCVRSYIEVETKCRYLPVQDNESLSRDKLQCLLLKTDQGRRALPCDLSVYSRNRNFRLLHSKKRGKSNPFVIANENTFIFHDHKGVISQYGEDFNTFV